MTDHAALIARLEAVTEESLESFMEARGLDGDIALGQGWKRVGKGWADWIDPDGNTNQHVPHYTCSLDAALTLVPEGWRWSLEGPNQHAVAVLGRDPPKDDDVLVFEIGATPVLSLCIAALKAIQAREA